MRTTIFAMLGLIVSGSIHTELADERSVANRSIWRYYDFILRRELKNERTMWDFESLPSEAFAGSDYDNLRRVARECTRESLAEASGAILSDVACGIDRRNHNSALMSKYVDEEDIDNFLGPTPLAKEIMKTAFDKLTSIVGSLPSKPLPTVTGVPPAIRKAALEKFVNWHTDNMMPAEEKGSFVAGKFPEGMFSRDEMNALISCATLSERDFFSISSGMINARIEPKFRVANEWVTHAIVLVFGGPNPNQDRVTRKYLVPLQDMIRETL
jgi:hypothetical protein